MNGISADSETLRARLVASEEEFDEDAFDEEFDDDDDGDLPADESFEDDPPLLDPEGALPDDELAELAELGRTGDEDDDEDDGEQTGRFQL